MCLPAVVAWIQLIALGSNDIFMATTNGFERIQAYRYILAPARVASDI